MFSAFPFHEIIFNIGPQQLPYIHCHNQECLQNAIGSLTQTTRKRPRSSLWRTSGLGFMKQDLAFNSQVSDVNAKNSSGVNWEKWKKPTKTPSSKFDLRWCIDLQRAQVLAGLLSIAGGFFPCVDASIDWNKCHKELSFLMLNNQLVACEKRLGIAAFIIPGTTSKRCSQEQKGYKGSVYGIFTYINGWVLW